MIFSVQPPLEGCLLGLPEQVAVELAEVIAFAFRGGGLPPWFSRYGFRLLDPVKSVRNRVEFLLQLHDREALLPRERQRRFLEGDGWVAWPGPALAEFVNQFVASNRMLEGGFVIADRLLSLADVALPILTVVGTVDEIAPAAGVRAVRQAAPRADVDQLDRTPGTSGSSSGSGARERDLGRPWLAWARWQSGEGEAPENIVRVPDDGAAGTGAPPCETVSSTASSWPPVWGRGIARTAVGTAERAARGVRPS